MAFPSFLRTASGLIFGINLVVFITTCLQGGTIFAPPIEVLISMGAKDPVRLVQGEVWRFFTPVFIHVGIIHFLLNSMGLYFIGPQIEQVFGRKYFLLLYLGAGVCGNVFSSVFTLAISAGASGALFGLLGAGFYLERAVKIRVREKTGLTVKTGAFGAMVAINVALGFMFPGIDNAAHIGGLLFGVAAVMAMLRLKPNLLLASDPRLGLKIMLGVTLMMIFMGVLGTSDKYVAGRLEAAGDKASHPSLAWRSYTQAIEITATPGLYFKRGKLLAWHREIDAAIADLREAATDPAVAKEIKQFLHTYRQQGFATEAEVIDNNLWGDSDFLPDHI